MLTCLHNYGFMLCKKMGFTLRFLQYLGKLAIKIFFAKIILFLKAVTTFYSNKFSLLK